MTTIIREMKCHFPIIGMPVSQQSKHASRKRYKARVTEVARKMISSAIGEDDKLKIEIDWFSEGFENKPDIDNIVKTIQDGLKGIVFRDDSQVASVITSKHDVLQLISFIDEPLCIVKPLMEGCQEYVYVRIY